MTEETGKREHTDIIELIKERYAKMSKSHKKIATYIMDHYDQAVFMTAAQLGKEVEISESTVVRFASDWDLRVILNFSMPWRPG